MKLQTKISLILIPLMIFPLLILGWAAYDHLKDLSYQTKFQQLNIILNQIALHVRFKFETAKANLELFSKSGLLQEYLLNDEEDRSLLVQPSLLKLFSTYSQAYPSYYEIRILLPDGKEDTRFTSESNPKVHEEGPTSYFQEMSQSEEMVYMTVFRNPDNQEAAFLISQKLFFSNPTVDSPPIRPHLRGYLTLTIRLDFIKKLIENTQIGKNGTLFFTDEQGAILFHPNQQQLQRTLPQVLFEQLLQQINNETPIKTLYQGESVFFKGVRLHHKLFLFTLLPEQELLATSHSMGVMVAGITFISILGTLAVLFLILNRLVIHPMQQLSEATREIGKGNLDTRISLSSKDEVGLLTTAFNQMAEKLEETEKATEKAIIAKSQFLADMSHEIRTPLNSIVGFSQLLMQQKEVLRLSHQSQDFLEHIKVAGQNLSELINNVLDLSKIESGKLELKEESLNLHLLVQGIYQINKAQALDKELIFNYEIMPQTPKFIQMDRNKLNQILMNLLSNAIKLTPAGKAVRLTVNRQENCLIFQVINQGIGISDDHQTTIFDEFEQADGSTPRKYDDTGLGLAIAKKMTELMGGQIVLQSNEKIGSTFTVTLSYKADEPPEEKQDSFESKNYHFSKDNRILIVEDNPMNQIVMTALFEEFEMEVILTENGKQGVEKTQALLAEKKPPDLILMDIHMPVMDGIEATRQIRSLPGCANIPIVAISAYIFEKQMNETQEIGIDDYVTKPIDFEKLLPIMAKYLRQGRSAGASSSPEVVNVNTELPMLPQLPKTVEQFLFEELKNLLDIPIFKQADLADTLDNLIQVCQRFHSPYLERFKEIQKAVYSADKERFQQLIKEILNGNDPHRR